ncbi:MAG: hypothetical protein AAF809_02355 [Bacteroidota bacterium]
MSIREIKAAIAALSPAEVANLAAWLSSQQAGDGAVEEVQEPEANQPDPSVYDLIEDLVGSVEGPGDLSTNPAYMEDFGRSPMR